MAVAIRQVEPLEDNAEGLCCGLPYVTELAGPSGVSIHFWVGQHVDQDQLKLALATAQLHRDIVRAQWSHGMPTKFWAQNDM